MPLTEIESANVLINIFGVLIAVFIIISLICLVWIRIDEEEIKFLEQHAIKSGYGYYDIDKNFKWNNN